MNKLNKAIKAIIEILKNPVLLNNVLNDDSVWGNYNKKNYNKIALPLVDINQFSTNFSETLNHFAFLDGGSLPTDIALLKILSKRFNTCKYFEIGTWRGESVVNVAEVASECYTLNLSKEEILALGLKESYADLHGFFSKGKKNITHLTGNSLTYDFAALNKKFDLIFIDGSHHYDDIKNDTEKIFKHLVHEQSIIVWHDYAYNPERVRPEVMAAILDGTPPEFRNNLYHVSNSMSAIFTREKLVTKDFISPSTPNKTFKITLESKVIDK